MPFDVIENESLARWVECKEPLWLTADRDRLVAGDDPEAAFLFATPGKKISREDAERYGLVKAPAKKAPAKKEASPAEDKQAAKPETKEA